MTWSFVCVIFIFIIFLLFLVNLADQFKHKYKINTCKEVHSFTIMDINSDAKIPKADNEPVAPSAKLTVEVGERKAKFLTCPLGICFPQCETDWQWAIHFGMSLYLAKMESSYISNAGKT